MDGKGTETILPKRHDLVEAMAVKLSKSRFVQLDSGVPKIPRTYKHSLIWGSFICHAVVGEENEPAC